MQLPEVKEFLDLAVILVRPGVDVHCSQLMGTPVSINDRGQVIDEKARKAYESRTRELQENIADDESMKDLVKCESLESKLDQLTDHFWKLWRSFFMEEYGFVCVYYHISNFNRPSIQGETAMKRSIPLPFILLMIICVSACATGPQKQWIHPERNATEIASDKAACELKAESGARNILGAIEEDKKSELFRQCMEELGYILENEK